MVEYFILRNHLLGDSDNVRYQTINLLSLKEKGTKIMKEILETYHIIKYIYNIRQDIKYLMVYNYCVNYLYNFGNKPKNNFKSINFTRTNFGLLVGTTVLP